MDVHPPNPVPLRYNAAGGAIVRQSDLSSWSRCALAHGYERLARVDPDAEPPLALSATVFGTVVHYALMIGERARHEGREDYVDYAVATFAHYWHPDNIEAIAERVTRWLPRQTYGGLLERGRALIPIYFESMNTDGRDRLLGLEYQFAVPLPVNGRIHTLTGTIDRLSLNRWYNKPYLRIADFKTGKQPWYLRHNVQGTAYAYATTQLQFWTGPEPELWDGGELDVFGTDVLGELEELFASYGYSFLGTTGTRPAGRRFQWINLQEVKFAEGGWRSNQDYTRLGLAVDQYVKAIEAGVFTMSTSGDVCEYCQFKKICGGVGLATDGAPE